MSNSIILVAVALLAGVAYWMGKQRSLVLVGGSRGIRKLHSLPSYYGLLTALWCALPALVIMGLWLSFQDSLITHLVLSKLPAAVRDQDGAQLGLVLNDVRNVVEGNVPMDGARPEVQAAARQYLQLRGVARGALTVIVLVAGVLGLVLVRRRIAPQLRARNAVERIFEGLLLACSMLAVFVTIGIVISVLYESVRFFTAVPVQKFLFGLHVEPADRDARRSGGRPPARSARCRCSPGTLLISGIAMCVAVPVGLFSAIYLAEYANRRFRAIVKPVLEILAGIPTVVYGFFAALTVARSSAAWASRWASTCRLRERARGRPRHGHHDHSLRLLAVRRHDHGRAAVAARRCLRAGRDAIGDDPGRSCCPRRCPASSAACCSPFRARSARR